MIRPSHQRFNSNAEENEEEGDRLVAIGNVRLGVIAVYLGGAGSAFKSGKDEVGVLLDETRNSIDELEPGVLIELEHPISYGNSSLRDG